MKYSTAFVGKKALSSPYNCAANVLLWDMTSVGIPAFAITFAIVYVFPEPVTPRSVWNLSLRLSPSVSSSIAFG